MSPYCEQHKQSLSVLPTSRRHAISGALPRSNDSSEVRLSLNGVARKSSLTRGPPRPGPPRPAAAVHGAIARAAQVVQERGSRGQFGSFRTRICCLHSSAWAGGCEHSCSPVRLGNSWHSTAARGPNRYMSSLCAGHHLPINENDNICENDEEKAFC